MEQEAIYNAGRFDRAKVDLTKPPRNVEEYMRQVIVSRERCEDIAVAKETVTVIKTPTIVIPQHEEAVCSFAPSREWVQSKVENFTHMREVFNERRDKCTNKLSIQLPGQNDANKWVEFCLSQRCPDIKISPTSEARFSHHKGTPPTLHFMLPLPDRFVNSLILHLVKYYIENGHSQALSEWIFALLVAVRKPLLHDVVSQLRDFTRYLKTKRAELTEEDDELTREYTMFISIITIYFGQKDLADK
ncbi:unnamed protein product [Bursaphelenchus xylophilus]|uniref:Gem-associated protein 2 n=1 Tax=Bursaphelenchus xylophilus TaxID=6326 RepID=A0A1I7RV99_BURXY|nr:unnamed protein product [Bursaphelenchus xylophilus]CAG9086584.1 unnamed protein product [Bursaphelenchus xylophilus]